MFSSLLWEDMLLFGDEHVEPSEMLQHAREVEVHSLPYFVSTPFPPNLFDISPSIPIFFQKGRSMWLIDE